MVDLLSLYCSPLWGSDHSEVDALEISRWAADTIKLALRKLNSILCAASTPCPLWVKSRHLQRNWDVRVTPESDIGRVFSDIS
jgi:hypothetical protein